MHLAKSQPRWAQDCFEWDKSTKIHTFYTKWLPLDESAVSGVGLVIDEESLVPSVTAARDENALKNVNMLTISNILVKIYFGLPCSMIWLWLQMQG